MGTHANWQTLNGQWQGTSRLILFPGDPERITPTTVEIAPFALATMCVVRYAWTYDGAPQEGQILASHIEETNTIEAVFLDTWHMAHKFMPMTGHFDDANTVLNGSYAVPESPDWGWRIVLEPAGADRLTLRMYNLTPDGEATLGVEKLLSR